MKRPLLNCLLAAVSGFVVLTAFSQDDGVKVSTEQQQPASGYALPNDGEEADERLGLRVSALDENTREYLSKYIKKGWKCLEIGPGNGSIARWLASQVGEDGHVDAIDIVPKFTADEASNLSVIIADITTHPLAENTYDLIIGRDVMQHLKAGDKGPADHQKIVEKLAGALSPEGLLIIEGVADWGEARHVYGHEEHSDVVKLEKRLAKESRDSMDSEIHDRAPFLFQKAGLNVLVEDIERKERLYKGGGDYMEMLVVTLQQMKKNGTLTIDEDEQEAYGKLIELYKNPDYLFWSQGRIRVVGQKTVGGVDRDEL